jgi:hypothetical protein
MITDSVNISISLIILHSYTLVKIVVAISPSVVSPFITYYQYHTLHAACGEHSSSSISASRSFRNSVLRSL